MSVIKPPRIYFSGYMEWDPNTSNNNKWVEEWNIDKSDLNWDYLSTVGITKENYRSQFPKWASNILTDKVKYPCQGKQPTPGEQPGLWNYFGGNGCNFVNNTKATTCVTGGVLSNGSAPSASDSLLGAPISLAGNPFGGHPTPARLVDLDAASTLTSQIWFDSLSLGGDSHPGFKGKRNRIMQSRLINGSRNLTYSYQAGGASCTWQCCISTEDLQFLGADSPLLENLQSGLRSPETRGIMIRFCTYLTLYFQNGRLNELSPQPRDSKAIAELYIQALEGEIDYFSNPAYSKVVGSIGLWNEGDVQSAPSDRTLYADKSIHIAHGKTGPQLPLKRYSESVSEKEESVSLGPILIGFSYNDLNQLTQVHLDLSNTFPEVSEKHDPGRTVKAKLGRFEVSVDVAGTLHVLCNIDVDDYSQERYDSTSGMLDLPGSLTAKSTVEHGKLIVQLNGETVAQEQILMMQTDDRAVYLDYAATSDSIGIDVRRYGAVEPGQSVIVARYVNLARTAECEGVVDAITSHDTKQYLSFLDTDNLISLPTTQPDPDDPSGPPINTGQFADVLPLKCTEDANALFQISACNPGICYLVFYPTDVLNIPQQVNAGELLKGAYGTVRIMPDDHLLPQQFVNVWNGVGQSSAYDPALAWTFVYDNILRFYDMMYPVMARYVPLGDRKRVEAAVNQLEVTLSKEYMRTNSTMMMPITRDLSAGKRSVLLSWCALVKSNYQPVDLPPAH